MNQSLNLVFFLKRDKHICLKREARLMGCMLDELFLDEVRILLLPPSENHVLCSPVS